MNQNHQLPLALIVAMARNRVIGKDNQLPWHLPSDLKYFKQTTLGKPVIMGRRTFDSIGRPLPGRKNIVITRQPHWQREGVSTAVSLPEAIALGRSAALAGGAEELMVIGGAQIYAEALPLARRLYVTEVQAEVEGDARFPELSTAWQEVSRESGDFDPARDDFPFDIVVLERRA